ncbi:MAG: UDP-N-acetylmuramoyl-L-alanyl-D-glutamate--2,6-diaminopimelate ligase [Actinomycetes bacterium]|jgi:UDP-N-acetylmuramoyl-L-alanyl-D-glutamate--2,6-diaminopimelate ligase|nr:UDP-N-acetylmuramoyl-L-alanyl-D-glutamate--2,6-diaminopimelate ligase [Actinomycetes bacterium]
MNEHPHTITELLARSGGALWLSGDSAADIDGTRVGEYVPTSLAHDSRRVTPGSLFFAVPGFAADGHDYVSAAADAGAVAAVVEHPVAGVTLPQFGVADVRRALAYAAAAWYGDPSHAFALTGVTGTNGKTTTCYLLDAILRAAGRETGLIGTVETRVAGVAHPSERTTPDALALQELFAQMRDSNVGACVMEVSSHALDLHRVDASRFAVAAFTNLTQDHLDYHSDMDAYRSAKESLFTAQEVAARVVCVDTDEGRALAQRLTAAGHEVITAGTGTARETPPSSASGSVGLGTCHSGGTQCNPESIVNDDGTCGRPQDGENGIQIIAAGVHRHARGSDFTLVTPEGTVPVTLPLLGAYNVSNAVTAAACAWAQGIAPDTIARGLNAAPQVPGRLEQIEGGRDFQVVVDYAHTPDALRVALSALRAVTPGRVIVVCGCGGDRDRTKRPLMGRAAGQGADVVYATSDNPRSENPASIIDEMLPGLAQTDAEYHVVVERDAAIRAAITGARAGDCVLIAGKGHEDYQIFADRTIHFDDREQARAALLDGIAGEL